MLAMTPKTPKNTVHILMIVENNIPKPTFKHGQLYVAGSSLTFSSQGYPILNGIYAENLDSAESKPTFMHDQLYAAPSTVTCSSEDPYINWY